MPDFTLIVGLGNPGPEYVRTYHNAGALALAAWAGDADFVRESGGSFAHFRRAPFVYVRPLTYMNESGAAVRRALAYFRKTPASLILLHDDSDLPLGEWKVSAGQGSAGHRGVKSVIEQLGTKDFARLRIGIRTGEGKAGDFVLQRIRDRDLKILYGVFEEAKSTVMEKDTPSGSDRMSVKGTSTL